MRSLILALLISLPLWSQSTNETQFDTATTATNCGTCSSAACSTAGTDSPRSMNEGATAGTVEATETHAAATNNEMVAYFEDTGGLGKDCDTGTATTRLNVTTANTNFSVTEICICQGTTQLGSFASTPIFTMTAGVHTQTVSISSDTGCNSNPVRVIYCGDVGGSHGNESYGFTPDQDHTIPTPAPPAGQFPIQRRMLRGR